MHRSMRCERSDRAWERSRCSDKFQVPEAELETSGGEALGRGAGTRTSGGGGRGTWAQGGSYTFQVSDCAKSL